MDCVSCLKIVGEYVPHEMTLGGIWSFDSPIPSNFSSIKYAEQISTSLEEAIILDYEERILSLLPDMDKEKLLRTLSLIVKRENVTLAKQFYGYIISKYPDTKITIKNKVYYWFTSDKNGFNDKRLMMAKFISFGKFYPFDDPYLYQIHHFDLDEGCQRYPNIRRYLYNRNGHQPPLTNEDNHRTIRKRCLLVNKISEPIDVSEFVGSKYLLKLIRKLITNGPPGLIEIKPLMAAIWKNQDMKHISSLLNVISSSIDWFLHEKSTDTQIYALRILLDLGSDICRYLSNKSEIFLFKFRYNLKLHRSWKALIIYSKHFGWKDEYVLEKEISKFLKACLKYDEDLALKIIETREKSSDIEAFTPKESSRILNKLKTSRYISEEREELVKTLISHLK